MNSMNKDKQKNKPDFIDDSKYQVSDSDEVVMQNKEYNIQKQALGPNTKR